MKIALVGIETDNPAGGFMSGMKQGDLGGGNEGVRVSFRGRSHGRNAAMDDDGLPGGQANISGSPENVATRRAHGACATCRQEHQDLVGGEASGGDSIAAIFEHYLEQSEQQPSVILEVGAGTGRLAADLLASLGARNALPDRYLILDLSGDLRARQRETIAAALPELIDRVEWLDRLPEQFSGAVVANELLDVLK